MPEDNTELIQVGIYNEDFNLKLGLDLDSLAIYRSKGLPAHMVKRKHFNCLKYIEFILEIIANPDYIGINPNESGASIELIKKFENNVMIGIKLDSSGDYYYVSTMHDIQESKLRRRIHSGRIKEFDIDNSPNS